MLDVTIFCHKKCSMRSCLTGRACTGVFDVQVRKAEGRRLLAGGCSIALREKERERERDGSRVLARRLQSSRVAGPELFACVLKSLGIVPLLELAFEACVRISEAEIQGSHEAK